MLCETHTELSAKAFSLYGVYTELKMQDKIKAVENEIIRQAAKKKLELYFSKIAQSSFGNMYDFDTSATSNYQSVANI